MNYTQVLAVLAALAVSGAQAETKAEYYDRINKMADALERQRLENSPPHGGPSYERCLLKEAPGIQNKAAAHAVRKHCEKRPAYYGPKKSDGFFGYDTAYECIKSKGKSTTDRTAGILIAHACRKLYP